MNESFIKEETVNTAPIQHPVNVLLVDDEERNLLALKLVLSGTGENINYILCKSAEDALRQLLKIDIALILLDVNMPVLNGYELATMLKDNKRTRDIPIIFITAHDPEAAFALKGFETGAVDFLFKPINPEITKAKVKVFINLYLQRQELLKNQKILKEAQALAKVCNYEWYIKENKCIYSDEFYNLVGYEKKEIKGAADLQAKLLSPEDVQYCFSAIEKVKRIPGDLDFELRIIKKDGKPAWLQGKAVSHSNSQGEVFKVTGYIQDITERKESEILLKDLNKELEGKVLERTKKLEESNDVLRRVNADLDNFIYAASHDLKAPLNNVEGLLSTLFDIINESEINQEDILPVKMMVHQCIDQFKNTINDLSEIITAQNEMHAEAPEVSFEEILEEVKGNIKDLIEANQAVVRADFSQLQTIHFSKKNLRSIIFNLLSNAIKYRSPERTPNVTITTLTVDPETVALSVEDNGLGIREEDKEKVFAMFKRLHDHVDGTGIGMGLVKRIIDNCGGKIELESEVGKGSKFTIFLKKAKNNKASCI